MWLSILIGAAACYSLKLAGLSVPDSVLRNRRVQQISTMLPVALLVALTMTQTFSQKTHLTLDARAVGLIVAVLAVVRRMPFLAVIALAAGSAVLFRLIV
ncbi:MAG: AzlD domain-containing protein [Catenulispora sp.]|nr:AzlD domain-containing protein [Catenulispora sp.]